MPNRCLSGIPYPFLGSVNAIASIGVEQSYDSRWIYDTRTLSAVMGRTRDLFNNYFAAPIASNITVRHHNRQTGLKFERQNGGNHVILMNLTGNHIQTVHYFAHEYLHILAEHWQTRTGSHTCIEECMATTAAYFVLRRLREQLNSDQDRPLWDFDKGLGKIMQGQIGPYMDEIFPDAPPAEYDRFVATVQRHTPEMEREPYGDIGGTMKFTVAYQISEIFEGNPDIWPFGEDLMPWNIVRYVTPYGPVSWEADQPFEDYVRGWYFRTPASWSNYVWQIAERLGTDVSG